MPKIFRFIVIAVFAAVLAAPLAGIAAASPSVIPIDILAVNDFHGALAAQDRNPGAAALAAYLEAQRAKNPAGTIILSAGDMFQGTPDSNLLYGKTVMEFMNTVGFDAMALGNHEFDWGVNVLQERIRQAAFPLLAANIVDKATGRPAEFVRPYVILERRGVKIAVVGLITQDTAVTTNPKNVADFSFASPEETMKNLLPALKSQGVDIIVALCHLASYPGDEITGEAADVARVLHGAGVVVSGHSHERVAGKVAGVPVVQAYYNGRAAAAVRIAFDLGSREILGVTAAVADIPAGLAPDRRVAAIVARSRTELAPIMGLVLGHTAAGLAHDRYKLSPLGQFAADAMRQAVQADIALQNGGGLRASLAAGPVTMGDLYAVMPFDNTLYTVEMTGAQVLAALEHGIDNPRFGSLQFSGLQVKYDPAGPPGRRVVAATLDDGEPLAADRVYTVATSDFLVAGGDDYVMVKEARRHTDTYRSLREVVAAAVRKAGTLRFTGDGRLAPADGPGR